MNENRHFTGRSFNIYLDDGAIRNSFDSLEGLPTAADSVDTAPTGQTVGPRRHGYGALEYASGILPGLVLAMVLAWGGGHLAAIVGSDLMNFEHSPLSPILVSVVLGLMLRNLVGLPKAFESGLAFCVKRLLRIGVGLLGLRLSLGMAGQIGLQALPIVLCTITFTMLFVTWMGRRFGVSTRLASLIAVGTAICGVSAIVATAPSIDAKKDEIGYAVGVITLFGMVGLFVYPTLAHWIFAGDPVLAGYFLGTAIHDTSQVAGAGLMYQIRYGTDETLAVATTAKLVRNLMMGAIIPLIAVMHQRQTNVMRHVARPSILHLVPLFIVGFVAMASIRSIGDLGDRPFGFMDGDMWAEVLGRAGSVSTSCLALAMASIGLGTDLKEFRQLGWRPLGIGFSAALLVGVVGFSLVQYFV